MKHIEKRRRLQRAPPHFFKLFLCATNKLNAANDCTKGLNGHRDSKQLFGGVVLGGKRTYDAATTFNTTTHMQSSLFYSFRQP